MTNEKKRPPHQKMIDYLEAQIACGVYRAGDKLPTLAAWCKLMDLSSYSVQQALKSLEQKGIVELRRGSGSYVAIPRKGTNAARWKITVFSAGSILSPGGGYLAYTLTRIIELAALHNCIITHYPHDYYHPLPPEDVARQAADSDALLFLGEYDYHPLDLPLRLPSVGVGMVNTYGGALSPVVLDPIAAAELAVDFFRRRKIKKVRGFATAGVSLCHERIAAFQRRFQGEFTLEEVAIGKRTARLDTPADTGLLFFSGNLCERYIQWCEQRDGVAPDRLNYLSIDGKSLVIPGYHPVSTVWIDWKEIGETAFNEVLRRLKNPGAAARRIGVIPKLMEL